MTASLHESISYLWGRDVLVNSMNRIHAINKLIATPKAKDQEIEDILKGTKEAWEGLKTFFYKVTLTLWVLLSETHRITFNAASVKLLNLINKVSHAVEPIFADEDEYEWVEEDAEEDLSLEKKKGLQKEISDLEEELHAFEKVHKNVHFIRSDIKKCEEVERVRKENPPLIDRFDELSLELFKIEDALKKQKPAKKTKNLPILSELDQKEKDLKGQLTVLKEKINENSLSIQFNDFKDLKDADLKKKMDELRSHASKMEDIKEKLKRKEKELEEL